jgi:hypothetical protein
MLRREDIRAKDIDLERTIEPVAQPAGGPARRVRAVTGKPPRRIDGWSAFLGWLLVGGLLGFAVVGAASVGVLALPFVIILAVMMVRSRPPSHSLLGLIAGVGVLLLFIGVINLGTTPCDETGTLVDGVIVFGSVEGGSGEDGAETSCGGFAPAPWLAVGGTALASGTALFAIAERRPRGSEVEQDAP